MATLTSRQLPDTDIVRRVLAGKRQDFGLLVERHLNAVQAVAYAHTRRPSDVDDIAQEAFAKALQRLDSLRDPSKFRAWLLTIVRRLCADAQTARGREADLAARRNAQTAIAAPDPGREELRQLLLQRIYGLGPTDREVLLLHYYAGFSTREIADEIDVSQEAVKKRLQRARDALSRDVSEDLKELLRPEDAGEARTRHITRAMAAVPLPWLPARSVTDQWAAWIGSVSNAKAVWLAASVLVVVTIAGWQAMREPQPPVAASAPNPGNDVPPPSAIATGAGDSSELAAQIPSRQSPEEPIVVARAGDTTAAEPAGSSSPALPPLGSIMALTLKPNGDPEEGVAITAERVDWEPYENPPEETLIRRATSDAHGRHFFADLPLGDYVVRANGEDVAGISLAQLGVGSFTKESRLYLRPSSPVSGRVVDAEGEPVPNAYLYTYGNQDDPEERYLIYRSGARTQTNDDGRFAFTHLSRDQWKFYVIADGYAVYLSDYVPAGTDDVEFVLTAGKTAVVSVMDEQGQPLDRVAVQLAAEDAYRDRRTAVTAEDGTAFFTNLRDTAYLATLPDARYAATTGPAPLDTSADESAVTVTAQPAGSVSGNVTLADGAPVSNAVVRAEPPQTSGFNPVTATTDDEGRYMLAGLGNTEYTVTARHYGGFVPTSEGGVTVSAKPGDRIEDTDFEFADTAAVTGRVTNAEGQNVPGAEVRLSAGYPQSVVRTIVLSGSTGGFAFRGLRPGAQYYVWAKTDTQLSPPTGPLALTEDPNEPLTIRIDDPATVSGVVVDQDGNLAPGVGVMASAEKDISHTAPATSTHQASLGSTTTTTEADGSFSISGIHGGDYDIHVSNPGDNSYRFSNVRSLTLEPGERRADLAVVWEDTRGAFTISGRVVDRLGQPLRRAYVFARATTHDDFHSASTDDTGRFVLKEVRGGEYDLSVSHDRYTSTGEQGVPAGASGLTFVLQDRGDLELRVADAATRSPLKHFDYGVGRDRNNILRDGLKAATTDDGELRVRNLEAGDKAVLVRANGYADHVAHVRIRPRNEGDSSLTVRLKPAARIDALITDPNGNPLSQAVVLRDAYMADPQFRSHLELGTTDSRGRILIDHLSDEPYDLYVDHADHAPLHVQLKPVQGETLQESWELQQGGTISGKVLHAGLPAGGTYVSVMLSDEHFQAYMGTRTADDGTFSIKQVPTGTQEVWTQWRPEDNMHIRWNTYIVTVAEGQETTLHADMPAGTGALEGHYYVNGSPSMSNMYVILRYSDGSGGYQFGAHGDGAFHLDNMPPGVLTGEARFTDPATGEETRVPLEDPITIRENETTELDIELMY